MTLGNRLPTPSSGRRIQRYKTAGPGTLRVYDFKNPATYVAGVVPEVSLPNGTLLYDLPDASTATPAHPATIAGSSITRNAAGALSGTWSVTDHIALPSDFILPALSGVSGHYLIILGFKPTAVAAPGSAEVVAGCATNTGTNANWLIFRNSGNANYFAAVSNLGFVSFGVLTSAYHRMALEVIRDGVAGTVTLNAYVDTVRVGAGAGAVLASIPQPATAPRLGAYGVSGGLVSGGAFGSTEIRDLSLDIAAGLTVESILAADWAAWGGRFA